MLLKPVPICRQNGKGNLAEWAKKSALPYLSRCRGLVDPEIENFVYTWVGMPFAVQIRLSTNRLIQTNQNLFGTKDFNG